MLIASPESARWRKITLALLVLLGASYLWYSSQSFTHGGSWPGIAYGTLAFALILLLLFFGVRKRWHRSRFGTLESWLQSHLYLGLLSLVVVLFHTGFRFRDKVAVAALVALALVVVTGMIGTLLYTIVPRLLTDVGSNLSPEEMGDQLNQLSRSMARLSAGRSSAFQASYRALLSEAAPGSLAGWRILFGGGRRKAPALLQNEGWAKEVARVPAAEQEDLRRLLVFSRQQQELHRRFVHQQRYRNLLDIWLFAHIPLSVGLLILVLVHLVAVAFYAGV